MTNGVRNGSVSFTWEQEFCKMFSFLNELPRVLMCHLFVYMFLINLQEYVHVYPSLRHENLAFIFQQNKVHGHSQFINRQLHFFVLCLPIDCKTLDVNTPIPAAASYKKWFCGRWLAGIVGFIPAGGMDVCLL